MIVYKIMKRKFKEISILLCLILLLQMIITPSAYTLSIVTSSSRSSKYIHITNIPGTLSQIGKLKIIVDVTEIELLNDLAIIQATNRGLSDFHRHLNRTNNILIIPVIGYILSISFLLYSLKKVKQRICVLAFSIGGHAPPCLLS